ncbi:MAG: anti-sigma factor family protein, partial [Candidatus Binatia bacterium]
KARPKRKKSPAVASCKQATSLIADYVTGRLPATVARSFDKHLAICPDCVAFLKTYKKTVELAQGFLNRDPASLDAAKLKRSIDARLKKVG